MPARVSAALHSVRKIAYAREHSLNTREVTTPWGTSKPMPAFAHLTLVTPPPKVEFRGVSATSPLNLLNAPEPP